MKSTNCESYLKVTYYNYTISYHIDTHIHIVDKWPLFYNRKKEWTGHAIIPISPRACHNRFSTHTSSPNHVDMWLLFFKSVMRFFISLSPSPLNFLRKTTYIIEPADWSLATVSRAYNHPPTLSSYRMRYTTASFDSSIHRERGTEKGSSNDNNIQSEAYHEKHNIYRSVGLFQFVIVLVFDSSQCIGFLHLFFHPNQIRCVQLTDHVLIKPNTFSIHTYSHRLYGL